MTKSYDLATVATSVFLCISFYTCAVFVWGYIAASNSPFFFWFSTNVSPVSPVIGMVGSRITGFIVNLVMALPFAFVLARLRRPELWMGIATFALGYVLWRFRLDLLSPLVLIQEVVTSVDVWMIFPALVMAIFIVGKLRPSSVGDGI